jgi:hypothetical protein
MHDEAGGKEEEEKNEGEAISLPSTAQLVQQHHESADAAVTVTSSW